MIWLNKKIDAQIAKLFILREKENHFNFLMSTELF